MAGVDARLRGGISHLEQGEANDAFESSGPSGVRPVVFFVRFLRSHIWDVAARWMSCLMASWVLLLRHACRREPGSTGRRRGPRGPWHVLGWLSLRGWSPQAIVAWAVLSVVGSAAIADQAGDRSLSRSAEAHLVSGVSSEQPSAGPAAHEAHAPSAGRGDAAGIVWYDDYHTALDTAQASGRWALLWFERPKGAAADVAGSDAVFACPEVVVRLREACVCARLDCTAVVPSGGEMVRLMAHPAFAELHELPGLALIDMRDEASPFFRQVVSVWPLRQPLVPEVLLAILDLPPGTLTQRTILLALRLHADRPASTSGHWSWTLSCRAAEHARHQAALGVQGHHDWPRRFEAINAELPAGLVTREVCAESWPGQDLWEAAQECVRSWRLSDGHWQIVASRPILFGFDMQRSGRGIWYAAGLVAAPP